MVCVLVLMGMFGVQAAKPQDTSLQIMPLDAVPPGVVLPWVEANDSRWAAGEPVFRLDGASQREGLSVAGWLATDGRHLLVRLDVSEPEQRNHRRQGSIWDGDFVRVYFDGHGDGPPGGNADAAGFFGVDDGSIGFALTDDGPVGWVFDTSRPRLEGAFPASNLTIDRDELHRLTRYVIQIPLDYLGRVGPADLPGMGVTIQVRDVNDAPDSPAIHLEWGGGSGNQPRPARHQRVAFDTTGRSVLSLTPTAREVWDTGDAVEVVAAIGEGQEAVLTASYGTDALTKPIQASPPGGVRYWAVRALPRPDDAADTLSVAVGKKHVAVEAVLPAQRVRALEAAVDSALTASPHPLFARHLRSLRAVVRADWARAAVAAPSDPGYRDKTLANLELILEDLAGEGGRWQSYLDGRRTLLMAYRSRRDDTVQFYGLTLPQGWRFAAKPGEGPAYPLFMELHGAGDDHYLASARFIAAGIASGAHRWEGYHVIPFGRGNSGYRDIGETDVWEAYDDVHRLVNIDPDRRYLFGFSMGGGGTWRLASRTPDRWAAIAIMGAGPVDDPAVGLARNVSHLPIYHWAGELDRVTFRGGGVAARMQQFADQIRQYGGTVESKTTPDVGHNYLGEIQIESYHFLRGHVRERPDRFAFVSDTAEHLGAWGVQMVRDETLSTTPSFVCEIDGQAVRIQSEGAVGFAIDLGADGLEMSREVEVWWNGNREYVGAVEAIEGRLQFGKRARRRW